MHVMIAGIDASNLRAGGGVTHLVELLRAADPLVHGFSQVIVCGGQTTLNKIEDRQWLVKSSQPLLNKKLYWRVIWQRFMLARLARITDCDVLFVPGGSYSGDFRPVVTMSQNMLPFEWPEMRRYGLSWITIKLLILRRRQSHTFRNADGLIFLTRYARDEVMRVIHTVSGEMKTIPHGINVRFSNAPQEQLPITKYSMEQPFRILYVSIVDVYKHQWHVAEAVAQLRKSGLPVMLDLVGPAYPPALKRLRKVLDRIDPAGDFVQYSGSVPHGELNERYSQADLCLFASSCENMPNILLEGMASGLPIACSNRGPMPEMLSDAGVYFDPENPRDIAYALRKLIESPDLRTRLAKKAFERAQLFSWQQCARETFQFMAEAAISFSQQGKK